ncbi:MAG: YggS family pyridoxal phosphate-dependent enzyme [Clostridiales bacterium]|nr:YggS family pyridoxal phosphate-dependent enzyme [Clostridiales bacterium]
MSIATRLEAIKQSLPPGVELVAVSKFHPVEQLREAYGTGQRLFGESRVQELLPKIEQLPGDIAWHFIGHLQTNKVKSLIGRCALIESVDSLRLLDIIDRESEKAGVVTRVLLQVHVAAEETKSGFLPDELLEYFSVHGYRQLKATHLCGIMGMATNTDDRSRVEADFRAIRNIYEQIKMVAPDLCGFDIVSMGMSDDRDIAIANGSTMVRIGTDIFGPRNY